MKKTSFARRVVAAACSAALACSLMPAAAVSAFAADTSASTIKSFTVTATNEAVGATYTKTTSVDSKTNISSVTKTSTDKPLYYLMQGKSTQIFKVTTYIEAKDLLGDGWMEGATFNFTDRTKGSAMPYEYDSEGKFYPNFVYNTTAAAEDYDTKDAYSVPMVMALDAQSITLSSGQTAQSAIDAANKDNSWTADKIRWMSGTPESTYTAKSLMAGNVFWTYDADAEVAATLTYSKSEAINSVTVNATDTKTQTTKTTSFDATKLKGLVQTASAGNELYYIMNGKEVFKAKSYIKVSDLFGSSWVEGASFNLSDRNKGGAIPYEYDADGKFYPNYTYNATKASAEDFDTTGAYSVPMVFILDAVSVSMNDGETASAAITRADKDNAWQVKNIRLAAGTPESLYSTQATMYGHVFWTYNDGADIVANVEYAAPEPAPVPAVTSVTKSGVTYKVSGKAAKVTKVAKSKKSVTIAKTVRIGTKTYKVSGIAAKAFKGTKVKTVTIKSTTLTKKTVKGCFKSSKVTKVKVPKAKKKAYKKIFTKKVTGKKVAVK